MNDLIKLGLSLAAQSFKPPAAPRIAGAGLLAAVTGASAFFALIFALIALWIFAGARFGPGVAPLSVAIALLAISLIALATLGFLRRKRQTPPPNPLPMMLVAQAESLVKANKTSVLLAAVITGILAGSAQ